MHCPKCGNNHVERRGTRGNKQTYQCRNCYKYFREEVERENKFGDEWPSILSFDVETIPLIAYAWGPYDQNINPEQLIKDWCLLAFSGKWMDDEKIVSEVLTPKEAVERDDERLVKLCWKMMDQADVVIAHNGRDFDIKKLNTRYLNHGLGPTTPFKLVDTLLAARSAFGLTYNKLDYIAQYLGTQRKRETDFQLWIDCDHGDKEALARMQEYNECDVEVLEQIYLKIRAYIPNHPKLSSYNKVQGKCPVCLSNYEDDGIYQAPIQQYKQYRCLNCRTVFHSTKPIR
jgi:transposase-like protein